MVIQTVSGTIDKHQLGRTYIHEHLNIDLSGAKQDPDANLDDIKGVTKEIEYLKSIGVDTIVEVTNIGMGRDISKLQNVWEKTEMNIVVSTGYYKEPFYPQEVYKLDYKQLGKLMIDELQNGIEDTGISAHVIGEVGTSKDIITDTELKVLKAAIFAHRETGHPIFTHTSLGTMALEQLKLFEKEKVDMSKVLIGHLDLHCDKDYHLSIADYGCYIGFDTIGKIKYEKDETRIEHIKYLIEKGFLDQIVLSQDITRKSHLQKNGGIGYSYLMEKFIPLSISQGIKKEEIDHMMIQNPKELLEV